MHKTPAPRQAQDQDFRLELQRLPPPLQVSILVPRLPQQAPAQRGLVLGRHQPPVQEGLALEQRHHQLPLSVVLEWEGLAQHPQGQAQASVGLVLQRVLEGQQDQHLGKSNPSVLASRK